MNDTYLMKWFAKHSPLIPLLQIPRLEWPSQVIYTEDNVKLGSIMHWQSGDESRSRFVHYSLHDSPWNTVKFISPEKAFIRK